MEGWIIFGAIVLFFVLLSFIKIGVVIGYKKDFSLAIKLLFFKIKILPAKEKKLNLKNYTKKKVEAAEAAEKLKKDKKDKKKKEKKEKKAQEKQLKKDLEKENCVFLKEIERSKVQERYIYMDYTEFIANSDC